jgi:hypothetical protein
MNDPRVWAKIPPLGANSNRGAMAQQVAHLLCKQGVRGSSPLGSTLVGLVRRMFGHSGKAEEGRFGIISGPTR